jgi:hypothetical protein
MRAPTKASELGSHDMDLLDGLADNGQVNDG